MHTVSRAQHSVLNKLALLDGVSDEAVVAMIAPTLPWASPHERIVIARRLLKADRRDGHLSVIACLDQLSSEIEAEVRAAGPNFDEALRQALADEDEELAANALRGVATRSVTTLIEPVVDLLLRTHGDIARHAATIVAELAHRHTLETRFDATARDRDGVMDAQVARAARLWTAHRQDACLIAAALLAIRAGPELRAWFDDVTDPGTYAVRRIVAQSEDERVACRLVSLLRSPALAATAAKRIGQQLAVRNFGSIRDARHLLRVPARRHSMRTLDRPSRILQGFRALPESPENDRLHVELINGLDLTTSYRVAQLGTAVSAACPSTRVSALDALARHESRASDEAIESFAYDVSPAIAHAATLHLATAQRTARPETLAHLGRSPHGRVRSTARLYAALASIQAFLEQMPSLEPTACVALGKRHLARQPRALIAGIRGSLTNDPTERKLVTIDLIRHLALAGEAEFELLAIASSSNGHLASAAVSVVASCDTTSCRDAVRVALRHRDVRVRANAVEAIGRAADRDRLGLITPMMTAREHRLRANAIVAFIQGHGDRSRIDPDEQLSSMLRASDSRHRISAIWAAVRARAAEHLDEITRIARCDPIPHVRQRARRAARLLAAQQTTIAESSGVVR